jgi:hypothetical protein
MPGRREPPSAWNNGAALCLILAGSFFRGSGAAKEVVMANKSLFASIKNLLPLASTRNEAGGVAYTLTPKHALARSRQRAALATRSMRRRRTNSTSSRR